jgi:hypothetical protein
VSLTAVSVVDDKLLITRFNLMNIRSESPLKFFQNLTDLWMKLISRGEEVACALRLDPESRMTPKAKEEYLIRAAKAETLTCQRHGNDSTVYVMMMPEEKQLAQEQQTSAYQFKVEYDEKRCQCCLWQDTGMICSHGIAARTRHYGLTCNSNMYFEHSLHISNLAVTFCEAYPAGCHIAKPTGPLVFDPTVLAPPLKKVKGRPRVKRFKSAAEGGQSKRDRISAGKRHKQMMASGTKYSPEDLEDLLACDILSVLDAVLDEGLRLSAHHHSSSRTAATSVPVVTVPLSTPSLTSGRGAEAPLHTASASTENVNNRAQFTVVRTPYLLLKDSGLKSAATGACSKQVAKRFTPTARRHADNAAVRLMAEADKHLMDLVTSIRPDTEYKRDFAVNCHPWNPTKWNPDDTDGRMPSEFDIARGASKSKGYPSTADQHRDSFNHWLDNLSHYEEVVRTANLSNWVASLMAEDSD